MPKKIIRKAKYIGEESLKNSSEDYNRTEIWRPADRRRTHEDVEDLRCGGFDRRAGDRCRSR